MIGLLGKTLKHSFSKHLHELIGQDTYHLLETHNLKQFFKETPFQGLNVTIPYKQDVIPYLDVLDESVKKTQTCNTIVKKDDKLHGYNTDYEALVFLFKRHIKHDNPRVIIMGNGATMRSVKTALLTLKITNVRVFARHPGKGEFALSGLDETGTVLINTTSVGMYPHNEERLPVDLTKFKSLKLVFDVVYNPLKTALILQAKSLNIPVIYGIDMLILQALMSRQYFFSEPFTLEMYSKTKKQLLRQLENIVMIGLPFSGKSFLGKKLADKLNKPWFDIDQIIEAATNMTVSEYFERHGEAAFRKVEERHALSIAKKHGHVISSGGGSILNPAILAHFKQNSCIIFIDLAESLMDTISYQGRPLVKNKKALQALNKKRRPLYLKAADIVIKKQTLDEDYLIESIKEAYYAYFSDQWT